jgi:hypothetical protein
MRPGILPIALLALAAPLPAPGAEASYWDEAARHAGLPTADLYGIALEETRIAWTDGTLRPWPWTINYAGQAHRYRTRAEAEAALTRFLESGSRDLAIGLMQIRPNWHAHRVGHPLQLLDPRISLAVAAAILREDPAPRRMKIAHHHSRKPEVGLPYADRVLAYSNRFAHAQE